MSIKTKDTRYHKTDKKIKTEFIKLLKAEGYNQITISRLIKEVNINRSTFYQHFLDKEDLMASLQLELIKNLVKDVPEINIANLDNLVLIEERIQIILTRIYQEKDLVTLYTGIKSDGLFFYRLSHFSENLLIQTNLIESAEIPTRYILSTIESVMISLIQSWIERDFLESPELVTRIVNKIMPNLVKNLVQI